VKVLVTPPPPLSEDRTARVCWTCSHHGKLFLGAHPCTHNHMHIHTHIYTHTYIYTQIERQREGAERERDREIYGAGHDISIDHIFLRNIDVHLAVHMRMTQRHILHSGVQPQAHKQLRSNSFGRNSCIEKLVYVARNSNLYATHRSSCLAPERCAKPNRQTSLNSN
jgi:hypothetical protein